MRLIKLFTSSIAIHKHTNDFKRERATRLTELHRARKNVLLLHVIIVSTLQQTLPTVYVTADGGRDL